MEIPKDILGQVGRGKHLFSYTVSLSEGETPWTYFKSTDTSLFSERFFWQSADKTDCLFALGAIHEYQGAATAFDQLQQTEKDLKQSLYHLKQTDSQGPVLCGAFAFDQKQQKEAIWGELGNGYFFLPELLVRQHNKQVTLTLTVKGETAEQVHQAWDRLQDKKEGLFNGSQNKQITETEQLDVTVHSYLEEEWAASVTQTVSMLGQSKEMEKVVLARQLKLHHQAGYEPLTTLTHLEAQQPDTYLYYLEKNGVSFIGATPERLLSGKESVFETAAVAGSTPRGKTLEEDQVLGEALLSDPKNIREHGIVVQRLLKELQPISEEIDYPEVVGLLKNRDIQHLYVPMTISRRPGMALIEAVGILHPTPALGGEPKEAALAWIREIEPVGRGLYGGPIGWLDIERDIGEFAVAIRSGVFNGNDGLLYAGCGVVADSVAELEVKETAVKFKPMLRGVTNQ